MCDQENHLEENHKKEMSKWLKSVSNNNETEHTTDKPMSKMSSLSHGIYDGPDRG